MFEELELDRITDEYARDVIGRLLNVVEELLAANRALQDENRRLQDDIAHLKGLKLQPHCPGRGLHRPDISSSHRVVRVAESRHAGDSR